MTKVEFTNRGLRFVLIVLLIIAIVMLFFAIQKYIACAKVLEYYNLTTCEGCRHLIDLGIYR